MSKKDQPHDRNFHDLMQDLRVAKLFLQGASENEIIAATGLSTEDIKDIRDLI